MYNEIEQVKHRPQTLPLVKWSLLLSTWWKVGLEPGRPGWNPGSELPSRATWRGHIAIINFKFLITLKGWWGFKEISVQCLIYILFRVDSDCSCFLTSVRLCMCVVPKRYLYTVGRQQSRRGQWCNLEILPSWVWPEWQRQNETQADQEWKNAEKQVDTSVLGGERSRRKIVNNQPQDLSENSWVPNQGQASSWEGLWKERNGQQRVCTMISRRVIINGRGVNIGTKLDHKTVSLFFFFVFDFFLCLTAVVGCGLLEQISIWEKEASKREDLKMP